MTDAETIRRSALTRLLYRLQVGRVLFAVVLTTHAAGCSGCSKRDGAGQAHQRDASRAVITIAPARAAYVTNNGSDSISVLDRDGDAVTTVLLDVDRDARIAPHHLAVDPATKQVFVALAFPPEPGKSPKRDPHSGHGSGETVGKLARLDLSTLGVTALRDVDENPGDVILSHDRRRVLITHFDMKRAMNVAARGGASPSTMFARLLLVDAESMTPLASRPVCVAPHGIAVTADDRTAFVACYGSDELAIVDLASDGLATTRIALGSAQGVPGVPTFGPYSATLSPDETIVAVADLEGQDVRVFDRASKRFLPDRSVPLSAKAFMPAFIDKRRLLVPTQAPDGLVRIDLGDDTKIEQRASFPASQCALPHAVRIAGDGRAYLVCEGDHRSPGRVLEVNVETLKVIREWTVGVYPDGIALGNE